eukprot:TRINITY_DN26637_c0_g1_i1.p1 TRINITY_DN26637_c0_g1~~TRINITY_DN26637_c0_g1_i1.p1  ORF type:complete len:440 (-),score=92.78 TRINITY_DN26637_c0_g1_i1:31-1350(-)
MIGALESELDFVKEILQKDLVVLDTNKILLKVKPHDSNDNAMEMVLIFPINYPESPPLIQLYPQEEKHNSSFLYDLQIQLSQEAESKAGESMIFQLYDLLQTKLTQFEDTICIGYFTYLPKDVIFKIIEYLDLWNTGKLCLVSKSFNDIIETPRVWESLIEYHTKQYYRGKDSKKQFFKLYLTPKPMKLEVRKMVGDYRFLASIVEREGTGDTWPSEVPWTVSFTQEIQSLAKIKLVESEKNKGDIISSIDKTCLGTYELIPHSFAKKLYSKSGLPISSHPNPKCCYVGPEVGWFAFNLNNTSHSDLLVRSLIRVCRGRFFDTLKLVSVPCIIYTPIWIEFSYNSLSKKNLSNIQILRNHTKTDIQWISKPGSPSSYSRHLVNLLSKFYPGKMLICYWVIRLFEVKNMERLGNEDIENYLPQFWKKEMNRTKGKSVYHY